MLLVLISYISKVQLPSGRMVENSPNFLSSHDSGFYYIFISDTYFLRTLKEEYGIQFEPTDRVSPSWLCAYLTESRILLIKTIYPDCLIVPLISSDKTDIKSKHVLSNEESYLINAHKDTFICNDCRHLFRDYYTSRSFPNLENPSIRQVSVFKPQRLMNRWSTGTTQTTDFDVEIWNGILGPKKPLLKNGIDGNGTVITIIDSGVDTKNCYFKDPSRPVPFNTTDMLHRKIIRYDPYGDKADTDWGHGTHVAGTAAGSANCTDCGASLFNGHAPNAKIYFVDASNGNPTHLDSDFDYEVVLNQTFDVGSDMWSCSWGDDSNSYVRRFFDELIWYFPHVTMFYAAGNEYRDLSILTPADSKNVIAVGSTNRPDVSYDDLRENFYLVIDSQETRIKNIGRFNLYDLFFRDPLPTYFGDLPLKDIFVVPNNSVEVPSDCQAKMIVFNQTNDPVPEHSGIPVFAAPPSLIETLLTLGPSAKISLTTHFKKGNVYSMSSFSSGGPSMQGLIKPEIVAPGSGIMSACASGNTRPCTADAVISKSGTSMATPAAAGVSALISQYLRYGFYFNQRYDKVRSDLVRAILINSAGPLSNNVRRPLHKSGFGLIHLADVLPTKDTSNQQNSDYNFGMRFSNYQFITNGQNLRAKVKITEAKENFKKDLVITLSYIDPPYDMTSFGGVPIYADMDLIVINPKGEILFGNQYEDKNEEIKSNNERIIIPYTSIIPGDYEVYVVCPRLGEDDQIPFSVVCSGPFNHTDTATNPEFLNFEKHNSCVGTCGEGKCMTTDTISKCLCPTKSTGTMCQLKTELIQMSSLSADPISLTINSRIPKHVVFTMPPLEEDEYVEINCTLQKMDNTIFTMEVGIGGLDKYGGIFAFYNYKKHRFVFKNDTNPNLKPGYPIYLSFHEATQYSRQLNLVISTNAKNLSTPDPEFPPYFPDQNRNRTNQTEITISRPIPVTETTQNVDRTTKKIPNLEKSFVGLAVTAGIVSAALIVGISATVAFFVRKHRAGYMKNKDENETSSDVHDVTPKENNNIKSELLNTAQEEL